MISRILTTILASVSAFLLLGFLLWYLAFEAGPDVPASRVISGLDDAMSISWSNASTIQVRAQSQTDALTALGYAHGHARTWQTLLWRQAALGRLSEWFGPDAAEIDMLMIRLGIARAGRRALDSLLPRDRAMLDKYSSGLNAALSDVSVGRNAPLVLLEVDIEPWEPFHSLAVERLLSWIAVDPPATSDLAPADSMLRDLLHVFGFEHNAAVMSEDFIAGRFITGDSGQPFFLESELFFVEARCRLLTVPGTLVFPLGSCGEHSWSRLLAGSARVVPKDSSSEATVRYERIQIQGRERVVRIPRVSGAMPIRFRQFASDAVLHWPGFNSESDTRVWLGLLEGEGGTTGLFLDDGFDALRGIVTVRGNPRTALLFPGGVHVSNAPVGESPAERVRELAEQDNVLGPELLLTDLRSPIAAEAVPHFLSLLNDSTAVPARLNEALTYLRNWNYRYDTNEIGASLFDVMKSATGNGVESGVDVLGALSQSIATLDTMFGADMRNWRWEAVQNRTVHFPGWTPGNADGGRPEEVFVERFAPIRLPGAGHPHTMVWGAHAPGQVRRATSAWEGAFGTGSGVGAGIWFRRSHVAYDELLGKSLASRRPLQLMSRRELEFIHTTQLSPVE